MKADFVVGIVQERDFVKKMYRIKAKDGDHEWFALPSEFQVRKLPLPDEVGKTPEIHDVMSQINNLILKIIYDDNLLIII